MWNTIVFAKDRLISLVGKSCRGVPRCELMNYCRRTHKWRFHREFEEDSSSFVSFPDLEDAEIRCSNYGWLLMSRSESENRCTLFFFNPFSNRTIYLRPRIGHSYTTLFFTHPPTSPDCTVVGIKTPFVGLFVEISVLLACGGEGTEWEREKHPTKTRFSLSSGPPIMHRGRIYFLDVRGNVGMFDVINRRLVTTNKCLVSRHGDRIKEHYLFELNGDQVFGVFAFRDPGKVKVRRLSTRKTNKTNMRWEKVEDYIGDNVVVYLSRVSSFSFPCTKKSMPSRIYFPRLLHGFDSPVFYSLSDAKFHSGLDDTDNNNNNNAPGGGGGQIKRLDHAAWVLTTPQLTATKLKPAWKFSHLFLSLFSVSGFYVINHLRRL